MEKSRKAMETENSAEISSLTDQISTSSCPFSGMFDLTGDVLVGKSSSSMGFMELLGIQDLGPSILDPPPPPLLPYSSDTVNIPATPNSSSISSSSTDEPVKVVEEEEQQEDKPKKLTKPKKKNQKRERQPRFAFMTKSEVDHLEDGYRWRKYGQKAVKNSPFPRSYYRCTSAMCNVKKRVERSYEDPTIVVTTYEGQHTHPSPVVPRGSPTSDSGGFSAAGGFALPVQMTQQSHQQQPYFLNLPPSLNFNSASVPSFVKKRRFCTPAAASNLLRDNGLLQDILPSDVRKDE